MAERSEAGIRTAEVLLPCSDLDATLRFWTELGFRLETISPADDPSVAVISGHGLRLRLQRGAATAPGVVRLACRDSAALAGGARAVTDPGGTRIELVESEPAPALPPLVPLLVVTPADGEARWVVGRAGMHYRDLVPGRQGGRFVASHIRIPEGGRVPDLVHHHHVRFQTIVCVRGEVRVAYEDQGPPLTLRAGDCVLQPPGIRHRVLEASPGLEVVEISSPAEHETSIDHELTLPAPSVCLERTFGGQRFVLHRAASATWQPSWRRGFECRDTGIAAATGGLASVQVARRTGTPDDEPTSHDAELFLTFVMRGSVTLRCEDHEPRHLSAGGCFVVPAGMRHALTRVAADTELLEVVLPAKSAESPKLRD